MFYVYDIEGIEPLVGPFTKAEAQKVQSQLGAGWGIMTQEEAESVYTHLTDEKE